MAAVAVYLSAWLTILDLYRSVSVSCNHQWIIIIASSFVQMVFGPNCNMLLMSQQPTNRQRRLAKKRMRMNIAKLITIIIIITITSLSVCLFNCCWNNQSVSRHSVHNNIGGECFEERRETELTIARPEE